MTTTRDTRFCKWLRHLGAAFLAAAAEDVDTGVDAEERQGEEDEMEHGTESNYVDEFNQLDLTRGVNAITDEDLFVQTRDENE